MSAPAFAHDAMHDEHDDERVERPSRRRARDDDAPRRPRWRAIFGLTVLVLFVAALASSPWWVPRALSRLAYFRVRRVEIDGARYAPPAELLARLKVDTTWSVWTDLDALGRRVSRHPLVASARVERHLPGTLRVVVSERVPVAMTPSRDGLAVLGADGRVLPIDPSRVGGVDVPVVASPDAAALRVLDALRREAPVLYARVSELRRVGRDELRLTVMPERGDTVGQAPFLLRVSPDVTPARLADLLPVESDLARRRVRVSEIDLRYRDQVIARLP
ncbi:Polypeptide-transport-associated domain protein FtsQ-type [Gemmatirosa kalamazoonensis]|uniref:Polypeptide-transport-associated domain protein FtsQ-type n=1 Tax=Gemmatirosa kalamazoonensis TaxID=861299 RepID=W0RJU4_9BACT|nr:FtsQ-type POTRA domain-containing protein [Gemmatirosa kalamazoonensis]AHG90615.1 Polypeptide-transport-associated domain protein FtsQ-type [Gemmatirosa kalamazoonensis]